MESSMPKTHLFFKCHVKAWSNTQAERGTGPSSAAETATGALQHLVYSSIKSLLLRALFMNAQKQHQSLLLLLGPSISHKLYTAVRGCGQFSVTYSNIRIVSSSSPQPGFTGYIKKGGEDGGSHQQCFDPGETSQVTMTGIIVCFPAYAPVTIL